MIKNKILTLLKTNKNIADYLFQFSAMPKDNKELFELLYVPEFHDRLKNIDWLYFSTFQEFVLIGVDPNNNVVAIDDSLDLKLVYGIQNIPYEIIRMQSMDETEDYFNKYKNIGVDLSSILKEYEIWCRDNNIPLDEHHIYHDEDGNLFNEYFEIENSIVDREDIKNAVLALIAKNLFGKNIY